MKVITISDTLAGISGLLGGLVLLWGGDGSVGGGRAPHLIDGNDNRENLK